MPHFLTHVVHAGRLIKDLEGMEYADLPAAKRAAKAAAIGMISEGFENGEARVLLRFHIEGEDGIELSRFDVSGELRIGPAASFNRTPAA